MANGRGRTTYANGKGRARANGHGRPRANGKARRLY